MVVVVVVITRVNAKDELRMICGEIGERTILTVGTRVGMQAGTDVSRGRLRTVAVVGTWIGHAEITIFTSSTEVTGRALTQVT